MNFFRVLFVAVSATWLLTLGGCVSKGDTTVNSNEGGDAGAGGNDASSITGSGGKGGSGDATEATNSNDASSTTGGTGGAGNSSTGGSDSGGAGGSSGGMTGSDSGGAGGSSGGMTGSGGDAGSTSCTPQAVDCDDRTPLLCDDEGEWQEGTTCDYVCSEGECIGNCVPETERCDPENLAVPQSCDSTGTWVSDEPCTYLCDEGACIGECEPQSRRCDGDTPQHCDDSYTWVSEMACSGAYQDCDDDLTACVATPVSVGTFEIDATEVTAYQYSQFLADMETDTSGQGSLCEGNASFYLYTNDSCEDFSYDPENAPNVPIACVDWCDAHAYCRWVGKRLCGAIDGGPTPEASVDDAAVSQWYAACSNSGTTTYPYGDTYTVNACNGESSSVLPVASLPTCRAGTDGAFDLSGNVAEFVDSYLYSDPSYYMQIRGGDFEVSNDYPLVLLCTAGSTTTSLGTTWAGPRTGFRCCSE